MTRAFKDILFSTCVAFNIEKRYVEETKKLDEKRQNSKIIQ